MSGDAQTGFWGLALKPDNKQGAAINPPDGHTLRVSSAALDLRSVSSGNARGTLIVKSTDGEFVVATLTAQQSQQPLDLFFLPGKPVSVRVEGNAPLHLTGYVTFFPQAGGESDDEEMGSDGEDAEIDPEAHARLRSIVDELGGDADGSDDDDVLAAAAKPGKQGKPGKAAGAGAGAGKAKAAAPAADDDDDDDDDDLAHLGGDSADDDFEGDEGDDEPSLPAAKPPKQQQQQQKPQAQQPKKPVQQQQQPKKPQQQQQQQQQGAGKKRKAEDAAEAAAKPAGGAAAAGGAPSAKKQKTDGASDAKTPGKQGKQASATPGKPQQPQPKKEGGGSAGKGEKNVKCSDPTCKRTFLNEASMAQHAKMAHKKDGAAAAASP